MVVVFLTLMPALALTACAGQGNQADGGNSDARQQVGQQETSATPEGIVSEGEALVIPVSDITDTASFYTVEVEGTQMEVIAVKAPDGAVRTAFNTCHVCYDSGRGYYEQSGDKLVCRNCGNRFAMDRVETEAGGCNPWPIFAEDKTVTDESITISYDFLKESKEIFANWKQSY
ncbi:MAG: DUF2318 domain-containing protein [Clostridiales Family XIII bacterium]|nr:DUF2318 domain-containing protein [Clostridiales Family XIII bacterium]